MLEKGFVHVYTGFSKGKTTAAMGLAFRALGQGLKVQVIQFLKGGEKESGEIKILTGIPGANVIRFPDQRHPRFCEGDCDLVKLKESIAHGLAIARENAFSGEYDLMVLDEVINCLKEGWLDEDEVAAFIKVKPDNLELVLTGRGAPKKIIELADYVTEMTMIKHPAKDGLKARKGIEF